MELHCQVNVVKAGVKGNTAAAAAAYISCDKTVGHDGRQHNYENKPGFVAGGFELPDSVPERWLSDPLSMWAEQDLIDYTKSTRRGPSSELYRSGVIGLPWDVSHNRAAELATELLEPLVKAGMCVQWAIHDVEEEGKRNYHLHWMAAMREVTPEGFGKKCRAWNKYNGGMNIPEVIRPHVAGVLNRELEAIGSDVRIEHESFADRGIDKIPTHHKGVAATAIERKERRAARAEGDPKAETRIYTRAQYRNRYIEWLNQIHAENLRHVETQMQSGRLEDLIGAARARQDGTEVFKDWNALFAMLRDARRCRAAMNSELGKLGNVISAYEECNEGYLRWAGIDPADEIQRFNVERMQKELRIRIEQMDVTEAFLLDSKELLKVHNKVVYTSKKAAWTQYQMDRNKRGIEYCQRRLTNIESYMQYLDRSISLFDVLFRTQAWKDYCKTMAELRREEEKMQAEYDRLCAELKQGRKDLKTHRKEAKAAVREERRTRRELDR